VIEAPEQLDGIAHLLRQWADESSVTRRERRLLRLAAWHCDKAAKIMRRVMA
jgi:hypothetical protein